VGLGYETVGLRSEDGVPLRAWWIEGKDGDAGQGRAAILVHGWNGDKSDEHVVGTAPIYSGNGYSVLVLDLRGHGESGGERRTLGYTETRDVRGALEWLKGRGYPSKRVVLHGWSMGGATVVRSAPGTGVAAVVEEAGYADLTLVLRDELPENSGLPRAFNLGAFLAAKLLLDFDPWAVLPAEEAVRLREEGTPLLVIHSTRVEVVPYEHANLFTRANPEADLWTLRGYDHVKAYRHPEYEERLEAFLQKVSP
jgi:fermentation-respiration switch protein FrsA (DUF1100 family)